MSLPRALQSRLDELRISASEASRRMGLTNRQKVNSWVAGRTAPGDPEAVAAVARFLEVDIDQVYEMIGTPGTRKGTRHLRARVEAMEARQAEMQDQLADLREAVSKLTDVLDPPPRSQ